MRQAEIQYGDPLTQRELDLVGQLLRGELAQRSGTIKNQFTVIYRKLGIQGMDRTNKECTLACRAYREGAFWLLSGIESPAERDDRKAKDEQAAREADAPYRRIRETFARTGRVPDTPFTRKALGMR
jgi:hypothetical protein